MGSVAGTDSYTASGYLGAAIIGSSITLSFKDVILAAEAEVL